MRVKDGNQVKDTPINRHMPATFMCNTSLCRCGRKRLSLIKMVLQKHLKAGFEKRGLTAVVIVMVTAKVDW